MIRQLRSNFRKQEEFIKKSVAVDIREIKKVNDGTLSGKDFKKILSYYGLAVPAVLGEGYCLLRGKEMSRSERGRLTYMGALTGLFDDFFDEKETPELHIREMINNPGPSLANNSYEELFLSFYHKALDRPGSETVKELLNRVCDAQVRSKMQKDPWISKEDIESITLEKGGASLLFYRCAFPEEPGESEKKMLCLLGGLGQLENDIFDIYKDYHAQVRTLATTAKGISEPRSFYVSLMKDVYRMLDQTAYPVKNKKKFTRLVSLISSRGLVCLDHLQKQEKLAGGTFNPASYSREKLICDMEKTGNKLKLFRYYLENIYFPGKKISF
ncbi:MAG: hypothetical protein V2I34_06515 [Bacteroidales bacterium]|jgi:hypothetical protein|nr:hypothetical protein [Bacteroidales bacterium]